MTRMKPKKILLSILFSVLVLFELLICSAFLPIRWQEAIQFKASRFFGLRHTNSPATAAEKAEEREIDQAFSELRGLRFAIEVFWLLALAGNSALAILVWKGLQTKSQPLMEDAAR